MTLPRGVRAVTMLFVALPAWAGASFAASSSPTVPKPRPRPAYVTPPAPDPIVTSQAPTGPVGDNAFTSGSAQRVDRTCLKRLARRVPDVRPSSPFGKARGCGVRNPVVFSTFASAGAKVRISEKLTLDCRFANTFATWLVDVVSPLAREHLGASLTRIQTGPGYNCRTRNRKKGAKLSEHAYGNAIDIASFTLSTKRRLAIGSTDLTPQERRFLRAVRTTACGYFTTVLGPGSNAAHDTHYHLDLGRHGRSGKYRICE